MTKPPIHHIAHRGNAVVAWDDVPTALRPTDEEVEDWHPAYKHDERRARLRAILVSPGCRAAVIHNPWWGHPKPWVPCQKPTVVEGWCERHRPAQAAAPTVRVGAC